MIRTPSPLGDEINPSGLSASGVKNLAEQCKDGKDAGWHYGRTGYAWQSAGEVRARGTIPRCGTGVRRLSRRTPHVDTRKIKAWFEAL